MLNKKFNKKDYILNEEVSKPKYYFGDKFEISSGVGDVWGAATLDIDIIKASVHHYGLGSDQVRCPVGPREWAYNFFMTRALVNGDGTKTGGGGYEGDAPANREEALEKVKKYVLSAYKVDLSTRWESLPGHFLWQHYSCEWGAKSIGSEVGESISSTQTHTAFCRGAARQYGIPWCEQFSFWQQGAINDYTGDAIWDHCSTATGGHSPSLYGRTLLAAYMGGASHFYPEACIVINYYKQLTDDGKYYKLSPIGKMSQKLCSFVEQNPDVGINYIPFGIVLDRFHGMCPGDPVINLKKVFQVFDFNAGDDMNYNLFDKLFPNTWKTFGANESTYMVNGSFGDNFDVLLQTASSEVLSSYPCLILSGDIKLSEEESARYVNYVKQGGTLILNTAYLKYFPEYEKKRNLFITQTISDQAGQVIVYGPDYCLGNLDKILNQQIKKLIPFTISDEIQYLMNVKDNSLILTLINNDGYYYNRFSGEDIDMSGVKELTVEYNGGLDLAEVKDIWNNQTLPTTAIQNITVNPGEFKVIEFKFA